MSKIPVLIRQKQAISVFFPALFLVYILLVGKSLNKNSQTAVLIKFKILNTLNYIISQKIKSSLLNHKTKRYCKGTIMG